MQDEISKHTKKIYKAASNSKHSFMEKVKEVVIEIFIIVFAVTLSISLHNWSEHRNEQKEVSDFLEDVKSDLHNDISAMQQEKLNQSNIIRKYTYLKGFSAKEVDSIEASKVPITLELNPSLRTTNDGNYEGFKSSGKISLIENKKIKKMILNYYQQTMRTLSESEKMYNAHVEKLTNIILPKKTYKEIFSDPTWNSSLDYVIQGAAYDNKQYEQNIAQAKEIILEIERYAKE